jgi:hypothetical protein
MVYGPCRAGRPAQTASCLQMRRSPRLTSPVQALARSENAFGPPQLRRCGLTRGRLPSPGRGAPQQARAGVGPGMVVPEPGQITLRLRVSSPASRLEPGAVLEPHDLPADGGDRRPLRQARRSTPSSTLSVASRATTGSAARAGKNAAKRAIRPAKASTSALRRTASVRFSTTSSLLRANMPVSTASPVRNAAAAGTSRAVHATALGGRRYRRRAPPEGGRMSAGSRPSSGSPRLSVLPGHLSCSIHDRCRSSACDCQRRSAGVEPRPGRPRGNIPGLIGLARGGVPLPRACG